MLRLAGLWNDGQVVPPIQWLETLTAVTAVAGSVHPLKYGR